MPVAYYLAQHPAREELVELLLDGARQAVSVVAVRDFPKEGLQVLGDDLTEHGVLGIAGPVDRSLQAHRND